LNLFVICDNINNNVIIDISKGEECTMLFRRMISIMTILSVSLCCCNVVFAEEISLNSKERVMSEQKEPLVVENLEIEGCEKSYDEESGLYVFTPVDDMGEDNITEDTSSERAATVLPDLSVAILSPGSGARISGPVTGDDTTNVKFRIYNNGGAMSGSNFVCTIMIDNQKLQSFYMNHMKANSSFTGSFDICLETYGEITLGIEADSLKEVTESNEKNNLGTAIYNIVYCTHDAFECFLIYPGDDLGVQIKRNAVYGNLTENFYSENLPAWNGITDDCVITSAKISDKEVTPDIDILIYADAKEVENKGIDARAYSYSYHGDVHDYTRVVINDKQMGNDKYADCCSTLIHELGHVFTLGHPNASCLYQSIMQQTYSGDDDKKSNEITLHDAYGVYNAYKNARNRSSANKKETKDTPKVRISISDYVPIHSIDDIENIAGYVIKAKVLEGKENTSFEEYSGGYTKINLEVTDVYKGDLNIGDIIPLMERYYIEDDGTELRRDGYSASEVGKEYLFFVGKYDDGLYDTVCTVLGRYSLENTQVLNGEVDTIETNIVEEYKPLYYQLKEEVINKYK